MKNVLLIIWLFCTVCAAPPLHVHVNSNEPVTVGDRVFFSVEISNTTTKVLKDVRLVLSPSFGLDIVKFESVATQEADEDLELEHVDEDGIIFSSCSIPAQETIYYTFYCQVFNQYYDEEEQNSPLQVSVYYWGDNQYKKVTASAPHFTVENAIFPEIEITPQSENEYMISVINIGPVNLKNVGALVRYNPEEIKNIDARADNGFCITEGVIFFYPVDEISNDMDDEGWHFYVTVESDSDDVPFSVDLIVDDENFVYPPKPVAKTVVEKTPLKTVDKTVVKQDMADKQVYSLFLKSAVYKQRKANNKKWDFGFGKAQKPDSFIVVSLWKDHNWVQKYKSGVSKNNFEPSWNIDTQLDVVSGDKIKLEIFDKDLRKNDTMGTHTLTIDSSQVQEVNLSFDSVEKFTFSLQKK